MAAEHPFASKPSISPTQLASERLITRESGSITQRTFEEAWAQSREELEDVFEVDSREALHAAVAAGLGIGVVDEAELPDDPRVARVPVTGLDLRVTEYIVCHIERRDSRMVNAGWQLALDIARDFRSGEP